MINFKEQLVKYKGIWIYYIILNLYSLLMTIFLNSDGTQFIFIPWYLMTFPTTTIIALFIGSESSISNIVFFFIIPVIHVALIYLIVKIKERISIPSPK
jgi:hypothetical protein